MSSRCCRSKRVQKLNGLVDKHAELEQTYRARMAENPSPHAPSSSSQDPTENLMLEGRMIAPLGENTDM
jgi:hypothetical protein